jgi:hypothetical protein
VFGLVRPCRHTLSPALHREWLGHLCGLCLALRGEHGQLARVATNYDGLLISVLLSAQSAQGSRLAGPCALRGMRTARITTGDGARLAATVSLVLASATLADHVADGDYASRPVAAAASRLSGSWARKAAGAAAGLGLDTGTMLDAVARQSGLERAGTGLLAVTEPTETATAAAFAHTAVLAGRPENAAPLADVGQLFGRLAHLLDAVEDRAADAASGAWNPLQATGTTLDQARTLADDAALGIRLALAEATLTDRKLAHRLLVHEVDRAIGHAFAHAGEPGTDEDRHEDTGRDPRPGRRRGLLPGCAAAAGLFCTCQVCCAESYPHPWTGEPVQGMCRNGCGDSCEGCCDCADCSCDCCDCCSGCDCT